MPPPLLLKYLMMLNMTIKVTSKNINGIMMGGNPGMRVAKALMTLVKSGTESCIITLLALIPCTMALFSVVPSILELYC